MNQNAPWRSSQKRAIIWSASSLASLINSGSPRTAANRRRAQTNAA